MHPKIIEAINERFRGEDSGAITRARRAGFYELILVSLGQYDLLKQILGQLRPYIESDEKGEAKQ